MSGPVPIAWQLTVTGGAALAHDLSLYGRAAEYDLLVHLGTVDAGVAVPRAQGSVTVAGRTYGVYARCGDADLAQVLPAGGHGPPPPDGYAAPRIGVARDELAATLATAGRHLAALHLAPPPAPGPQWTDRVAFRTLDPGCDLAAHTSHELARAVAAAEASGALGPAQRAALATSRDRLAEVTAGDAGFVHFDLHPRNVRVTVTRGAVGFGGFIDWKNAHYWLPPFDLATMGWHLDDLPDDVAEAFFAGYESRSGRPIDWSLVHACAVVRLVFVLARAGTRQRTWVEWCQRRLARLGNAVPAVRGPT